MIIVPDRAGQVGNQLFQLAHFAASSFEWKIKVKYLSFQDSFGAFPFINSEPLVEVRWRSDSGNLFLHRIAKVLRLTMPSSPFHRSLDSAGPPHVDTGAAEFAREALRKLLICQGFGFRDITNVKKYHDRLVRMFEPAADVCNEVDDFLLKLCPHRDERVLVGIHARRGDYREYHDGVYYFDDQAWTVWINAARELFSRDGKKFYGVVCSNEDVSGLVDGQRDVVRGPGGTFTDLEMLSRCDYLMGPPSTYSGWASFRGRVPLCQLSRDIDRLDMQLFQVVEW